MSENDQANGKSLKQLAYETLKHRIITCEITPGSLLTEDMLCEELNASRTPVRDAVSRLEQEHLVSIRPKKGIKVNRVSMNSIRELFEIRRMLEPEVVLRYGNRIRDEEYARFIRQFERTDMADQELFVLDDSFHRLFIEASGNRYYNTVFEMIADQVYRYRVLTSGDSRLEVTQKEHFEIAANCIRGEWDRASAAMLNHIENSKLAIVDYVMKTNRNARNVFEEDEDD